jgi:hypothetical protein
MGNESERIDYLKNVMHLNEKGEQKDRKIIKYGIGTVKEDQERTLKPMYICYLFIYLCFV